MKFKRYIFLAALSAAVYSGALAHDISNEQLEYKVMFKWGLINKQAGSVKIDIADNGDVYNAALTAASVSWADSFFKVRDTLYSEIRKIDFRPVKYEKMSHEGGDNQHDRIIYAYPGGDKVIGDCAHRRVKDGKLKNDDTRQLEAEGTTMDMLSAFFYMRNLPYGLWHSGQKHRINIFSGKKKELLDIQYHGIETIDYDEKKVECYKITFIFTSDGKQKSSDDMFAWIDVKTRIPVKLEGKLPVGSVKCFYIGK